MKRYLKRIGLYLGVLLLAAWLLPYVLPLGIQLQQRPEQPFPESQLIDALDVDLHIRHWPSSNEQASGRVLLVHGFAGSTFSWRLLVPELRAAGYEVIAVDLPGFGYSTRQPSAASDHQLLDAVIEQMWPQRSDPLHVFGHSMAADPVFRLGLQPPEGLHSLILVGGAPSFTGSWPAGSAATLMRLPPARRAVEVYASWRLFSEARISDLLTSAYGQTPDPDAVSGYLQPLAVRGTTNAIIQRMLKPRPGIVEPLPDLSGIAVHLIWGSEDNWVPLVRGQRTLERIPGAQLHVIEGSGHCPMETDIERFAALALPLLRENLGD